MQKSVVGRMKEYKEHTTALLTPWLRKTVHKITEGKENPGKISFLPGLRQDLIHFKKTPNIIQRQSYDAFSRSISQKYQDAKELIPLIPKFERGIGFWGELERIFPNAIAEKYEEPAQPGEMRKGTIIQKMDTFPKTGQTIEAFKAQSHQPPARANTKESAIKRKPVAPGQRLFTRVTEITPATPVESESPVNEPVERLEKTELSAEKETLPPVAENIKQEFAPREQEPPIQEESLTEAEELRKPELLLHKSPEPLKQAEPVKKTLPDLIKQASVTPRKTAVPVADRNTLPKAKPVQKNSVLPPEIKKAKALTSTVQKEKALLHVNPNPISNKVVQRTPEHPQSPKNEPRQSTARLEALPKSQPEKAENLPPIGSEKIDLPLQKNVEQRKQFAKTVNRTASVLPETSTIQPALINPQKPLLLNPRKYQVSKADDNLPDITAVKPDAAPNPLSLDLPVRFPITQQYPAVSTPARIMTQKPLETSPRSEQRPISEKETDPLPWKKPEPIINNPTTRNSAPMQAAAPGIVQRELPQESDDSAPAPSTPDYGKLAEDVFPYVKHLLEIENERTGGNLR